MYFVVKNTTFQIIETEMHIGGGERGRGAPHVPPIKIFEKLPHTIY
jgi:hypothetical protein